MVKLPYWQSLWMKSWYEDMTTDAFVKLLRINQPDPTVNLPHVAGASGLQTHFWTGREVNFKRRRTGIWSTNSIWCIRRRTGLMLSGFSRCLLILTKVRMTWLRSGTSAILFTNFTWCSNNKTSNFKLTKATESPSKGRGNKMVSHTCSIPAKVSCRSPAGVRWRPARVMAYMWPE